MRNAAVVADLDQLTEAVRRCRPNDVAEFLAYLTALVVLSSALDEPPAPDSISALLSTCPFGTTLHRAAMTITKQEVAAELRRRGLEP